MDKHPVLYEINTRVWLRRFDDKRRARLADVPHSTWDYLAELGVNYVWLMGVWKPCPAAVEKYCFENGLVREYKAALPDWQPEDVLGSPYAIDCYQVNPLLGNAEELAQVRQELQRRGIKLILDFVPNHFNVETSLLAGSADVLLEVSRECFETDSHTFYKAALGAERYFAHGRDPYFPAWQDTVQVNYFSDAARAYMRGVLLDLADYCDGVRCDMAMLPLNDVFENTWSSSGALAGSQRPPEEFWPRAIAAVKKRKPEFIFIAEAYWDLEWELQQQGFDYTYDKRLTDRLVAGDVEAVRQHLWADVHYQQRLVRFLENHDQQRALKALGAERSMAAAVITATLPGMRFFQDGQFEGRTVRVPTQLGREPVEAVMPGIKSFYEQLLPIVNHKVFRAGEWQLINVVQLNEQDATFHQVLAWQWSLQDEKRLIVINYGDSKARCHVRLDVQSTTPQITFKDLCGQSEYRHDRSNLEQHGLYVELEPFHFHVLEWA